MSGRKIYIRDPKPGCCKVHACNAYIDTGISGKFCTNHAPEHEAREELEQQRKKKKNPVDARVIQ